MAAAVAVGLVPAGGDVLRDGQPHRVRQRLDDRHRQPVPGVARSFARPVVPVPDGVEVLAARSVPDGRTGVGVVVPRTAPVAPLDPRRRRIRVAVRARHALTRPHAGARGRPSSSSTTQGCIGSSTTTSLRSPCGADSWPIRRPCSQSSLRMTTDPAIQEGPAWFGALFGQRRGPVPRVAAFRGRVRRSVQVVRAAGQPLVAGVAPGAAPPGPPPLGPPPMPAAACWMTLPSLSAPGPRPPALRVCAALRPRR